MTPRTVTLTGLGGYVPPRRVTNHDLAERLDTSDEWITRRTGIRARHWTDADTSTGDLAVEAGRRALASAGLEAAPGAVDMVVLATTTPDHPCPATAPAVADRLGLGPVAAFDIGAVCSGFIYAVSTAAAHITAGQADRVLVVGAETYSSILNPDDRTTAVIFGDGAGAVVLGAGTDGGAPGALVGSDLGSDGSGHDLIQIPAGGSRQRTHPDPAEHYFTMKGKEVFAAAVQSMGRSATGLLDRIGWPVDQVDHLVGHQANLRILTALARSLGIPEERAVVNIDRLGNTSAASIPLALVDAASQGVLTTGDHVLLTAFGGGLTWGSAALRWPDLSVEPLEHAPLVTHI